MDLKALSKVCCSLYVVRAKIDGEHAGCVADALIQSSSSPFPMVVFCSIQTNTSLKQTGAFSISVQETEMNPLIIGNLEFQSVRHTEKWECQVCGFSYNGATPFEQLPTDWICPVCGYTKSNFAHNDDIKGSSPGG